MTVDITKLLKEIKASEDLIKAEQTKIDEKKKSLRGALLELGLDDLLGTSKRAASKGKSGKLTEAEIEACFKVIVQKKAEGTKSGDLKEHTNNPGAALRNLLDSGRIKKEGKKNGTKYYPL